MVLTARCKNKRNATKQPAILFFHASKRTNVLMGVQVAERMQ